MRSLQLERNLTPGFQRVFYFDAMSTGSYKPFEILAVTIRAMRHCFFSIFYRLFVMFFDKKPIIYNKNLVKNGNRKKALECHVVLYVVC